MGGTSDQLTRITAADGDLRAIARRGAGTTGIGLALTTALAGLASWGALTLGVRAVGGGSLNGALLAVLALVPLAAFELVSPLPAATQALQRSRVAAGRIFEAMDATPVVTDPQRPIDLGTAPHTLELRDVWASYPGAGRAALPRGRPGAHARPTHRSRRPERRGQDDARRHPGAFPPGRCR